MTEEHTLIDGVGSSGPNEGAPGDGAAARRRKRDHLKPKNSAGRNLPQAIGTALVLGALVLVAMYVGPAMWYPVVCVVAGLGMWETLTRLRENGYYVYRFAVIVLGISMIVSTWPFGYRGLVATSTLSVLLLMFSRLFSHGRNVAPRNYVRDTSIMIYVLMWIGLFGSFAAMISRLHSGEVTGSYFIITFIACVVANDVGGYAAGVMFGSHPMVPAVSPKKSWEGFAGSVLLGSVTGILTGTYLLHTDWWAGLIFGLAIVVCATFGDLVESQFKRELGIKDMSALLPGHGGIMDRVDGILPAAAATWLVMNFVVV
ncbi:phosphatidate cytidylyltransferase [Corynebacterium aquatimens]|uniref:Phosphatidate cytidylyltransferase n=1 Tax=Corynebacterium aquatimens TaxID=1190508 RepID=A0A931E1E3_9CORY|nr:phosphatidate cytidylyltransferase [Corynebacterium aquatimens]MBG6121870.1 phosphatidate cytidylyltransferase [Corynebacterium aquatimens]WJY65592.1 Phosphatidate cytidylyltransferase [Corynebacterium aquatimens]